MKHADERTRAVRVNNGKTNFTRREKYCARHEDWIDITLGAGEWKRLHENCDKTTTQGAFVQLPSAESQKAFRKAA